MTSKIQPKEKDIIRNFRERPGSTPLVSVIMPSYNRASLIGESIRSVLDQRMRDWELLIVDDGSTDGTAAAVNDFASRDGRVQCVEIGRNTGDPAIPRNIALRTARGRYIAFLDSDDLWLPDKLMVQTVFLEENRRFGAVHSNAFAFRTEDPDEQWPINRFSPHRNGFIFERMVRGDAMIMPTVVMRRSCLQSVGEFREGIRGIEDYEFKLRFSKKHPIAYQHIILAGYRLHQANITADVVREREKAYRLIEEMAGPLEIPERLLRETLSSIRYYVAREKFNRGESGFREDALKSAELDEGNARVRVLLALSRFRPSVFLAVEKAVLTIWEAWRKVFVPRG